MFRAAFLCLVLLLLLQARASANGAIDYATYPTFYEKELPESAAVSAVQHDDLVLSLYRAIVTVWDYTDFSNPVQRGHVAVDPDAVQLIEHNGESYLVARYARDTGGGYFDTGGHLYWIDVSNPDSPVSVEVYNTGCTGQVTSWGTALIYNVYHQVCDEPPSGHCWLAYYTSQILHFSGPTQVFVGNAGDRSDQEFMGSGLWFWTLQGDRLTAYPSTDSTEGSVHRGIPLGSELISSVGDRVWIRTSSSTIDCFRASPDAVNFVRRLTSELADGILRIVPWQEGSLALGSFGVQIFGPDASSAPIWRVTQSPNFALVKNDRAWMISGLTGSQEIVLDPPVETPPRIGLVRQTYSHLDMSADGRFLFAKTGGFLDSWDLESSGGSQLISRTYLGTSSNINSLSVLGNRIAIVYPGEVQLYGFDAATGVPTYETSFLTQIAARAGAFVDGTLVNLSQEDDLEIHGTGQGTPFLGRYDSENFTNLQQLHADGTMVWFVSGSGSATEVIGVSIAQPQAPQIVAVIPLGAPVRSFTIDQGTLIVLSSIYGLRAFRFSDIQGVDDLGEYFPSSAFKLVCLRDGILYATNSDETQVWRWNKGDPELLGLQEGSSAYSAYGLSARGGSLALLTSDSYHGRILRVYPAQLPDVKVPVLLESFEVFPTDTRRHLVWSLGTALPVSSMRLIVAEDGLEKDLELERTSQIQYEAWDELRTHEVTYRLLEKQTDGSWIVLHEENVAGSALSWLGPKVLQNPARGSLHVAFAQPRSGRVSIDVIDLAGRRIARLQSGVLPSGLHNFQWDGRDANGRAVARGVYFLRSQSGGHLSSTKFTLVR